MPTKPLPAKPNLQHLKARARDLLRDHRSRSAQALQRIREFHPRFRIATDDDIASASFLLSDAQYAIAREYGFASWPRLKAYVEDPNRRDLTLPKHERIADATFRKAVDLLDAGDAAGLRDYLAKHPEVVRQRVAFEGDNYFTNPTLLEFIAENPSRRGRLPANIADVATAILDAGGAADRAALDSALALVASSEVARVCGAQGPLIQLLCDRGADPNSGAYDALLYGEFAAVEELIRRGAAVDLVVAAGTGRTNVAEDLLQNSDDESRQKALALAAQHGHAGVVRLLLDAGEDPNRYTPVGGHSHATPLHQAVIGGHEDIVRMLVERGARLDMIDIHHNATPLGWAEYFGHEEIAAYLRSAANASTSA